MPLPSPGDLPDPGIGPRSPAWQADSLLSEPPTGWSLRLRGLGTRDDASAESQLQGSLGRGRPGGREFSAEGTALQVPHVLRVCERPAWLLAAGQSNTGGGKAQREGLGGQGRGSGFILSVSRSF